MSAWIVGNESINKMVNSFYWLRENSYLRNELKKKFNLNFEGLDDDDLNEELRKFGQLIVNLNQDSINQRYESKDKPFKFEFSNVEKLSIYQFLKSVECLTYQSCEGDCEGTALYKFLIRLEDDLRHKIVSSIEEYEQAKWE